MTLEDHQTNADVGITKRLTPHEANENLADILIGRLNHLLECEPSLGETFGLLIRTRVTCSDSVRDHETIQVSVEEGCNYVGFLGMLNGIVGAIEPSHEKAGWGYVMAIIEKDGTVSGFCNTKYKPRTRGSI